MKQLGRLRLYEFHDRIIKANGFMVILIWLFTFFVGVMIGSSYWFKKLLEGWYDL